MESCIVSEVKKFDEVEGLFKEASKLNHTNSQNYNVDKMRKRWEKYLLFITVAKEGEIISFAGVYPFGNNLVRVCDRHFTKPQYRQKSFDKKVSNPLRPAVDYIIPYQTRWAKKLGYDCFFSIQELKKRNSLIRLVKLLDPTLGYNVLPGLYATCNPDDSTCWQNIASTTNNIHLLNRPFL